MRMRELQRRFRQANIVLAIIVPILFSGAIFLKKANANDGILQAFGMAVLFAGFVLLFVLNARYERRHQSEDQ